MVTELKMEFCRYFIWEGGLCWMSKSLPDPYSEYLIDEQHQLGISQDVQGVAKQLARYFMIKLGSASVGYPLELSKLLRQCQSSVEQPSRTISEFPGVESESKSNIFDETEKLLAKNESGFLSSDLEIDESGYIKPTVPKSSQWPMVLDRSQGMGSTALVIARRQGILSLWQGLLPYWFYRVGFDLSKAAFEETLESSEVLAEYLDAQVPTIMNNRVDLRPSIIPIVAQTIAGFLMSPFEVIQARLAIQSVYSNEKTYTGVIDVTKKVYREEGGIYGLFPNPLLTLVHKFLQPTLTIGPTLVYSQLMDYDEVSGGGDGDILKATMHLIGHFAALSVAPIVLLPLETIRRRLLVSNASSSLITRVPLRQKKYSGFWHCLWSIIRDEGVGALYEGFALSLTNNVLLLALNLATELDEEIPEDLEEF